MLTDLRKLPILDWDLSMRLAGNQQDLAKDILSLFIKSLPSDLTEMQGLLDTHKYNNLQKKAHKLHGALCYCGTPRLKMLISLVETDLKNNIIERIPSLLNQFVTESHYLFEYYSSCSDIHTSNM